MDGPKFTKKRKITDKSIPNTVAQNPDFAEDSRMYTDLLEMERRLDWTMTRKKAEVQDALSRNVTTTRTLRIFLSHTVSDQPWQTGGIGPEGANFETGEGIPAWAFRIEGRLLESSTSRAKDKVMQRKFSTFIKRMVIELDRDPSSYPDGNIIEWPKAPGAHNPVMDGFTVRRTGDTPTNIRVVLYLDHQPEQFKVQEGLANIIGVRQDSRLGVIQAMWNYIKINQLQDKADRTMIHLDEPLKMLLQGRSDLAFAMIPAFVNKFLQPPDPILLRYTLDPGMFPPERPTAWDVEVKLEDTGMKGRMHTAVAPSKEHLAALVKLDEEISLHVQSLHNAHLKRTFLTSFAEDPAKFIQTWLESQSRDLENILGSGPSMGATLRTEELRRSEFFKLPWVQEAVAVQEGLRHSQKGVQNP